MVYKARLQAGLGDGHRLVGGRLLPGEQFGGASDDRLRASPGCLVVGVRRG
jgi:hypothetical protein